MNGINSVPMPTITNNIIIITVVLLLLVVVVVLEEGIVLTNMIHLNFKSIGT